jgi:hypothetical protein
MANRLLNEAPDNFQINNLSYSFRVKPYLSFHIVTGIDQRLAFYTINRVHLHIISSFKTFLVETLKDYKPSKPSKDYLESGSAVNFVDIRHNRYMGLYDFNMVQFNEYTEKARQFLNSNDIQVVELLNKKFSIYDMFYFIDAYNSPKNVYLGGRMWDRASLVGNPEEKVFLPACSMYQLEYNKLDFQQTKSSLLKIIQRAYSRSDLFTSQMVSTDMAVEYGKVIFRLDISSALR